MPEHSRGNLCSEQTRVGRLTLQDFEVLDILVVGVGIKLDAVHGQVEEDAVKDLAQRSSGRVIDALVW